MTISSIGDRLSQARIRLGISKSELARKTKLSPPAISSLESGVSKDIIGANVFPIADALNISARWLLTGKEPKPIDGQAQPDHERADVLELARHLATLDDAKFQAAMTLFGIRHEPIN